MFWELSYNAHIGPMLAFGRATAMRWKISGHGHDPRQVDLIAIVAAFHFYDRNPQPPSHASFIVPSQSVRW